jgi:hypothetical protein
MLAEINVLQNLNTTCTFQLVISIISMLSVFLVCFSGNTYFCIQGWYLYRGAS